MNTDRNNYEINLDKNAANYIPLTPLSFIERTKDVYPDYKSVVYGNRVYTWLQTYHRCVKFASALERHGIGQGDTVSILAANTPEISLHCADVSLQRVGLPLDVGGFGGNSGLLPIRRGQRHL